MKVDLEKIKKAKGRTYINVEECPIPICVEDYVEYKKIERKLGIDSNILFKALENGVYYKDFKDDNNVKFTKEIEEHINWKVLIVPAKYTRIMLSFEDYGKTWAMTKRELL